jgi:type IV pilus assembly protein PilC
MAEYKYNAHTFSGHDVTGTRRARNPLELEACLAEEGLILQSYQKAKADSFEYLKSLFGKSEITRLTRQLSVLISSGITITEALESVCEQTNDKYISSIFQEILESVKSGESLHSAFGKYPAYFNTVYLALLEAGEISGFLDVSLDRAAVFRENAERINKKIMSALAYPALVLLVSLIVVFILIIYLIPIFSSIYTGFNIELPPSTKFLINISESLRASLWVIPAFAVLFLTFIFLAMRSNAIRIKYGRFISNLPVLGNFYVKLGVSRYCRTLGTLLSSGLQLIESVEVAARTSGSLYFENTLESVVNRLGEGQSLTEALAETKIFPKTVIRMTSAGESTGRLGEMFARMADFYEKEVDIEMAAMISIIEPIVIVVLGIIVGFLLIAMYMPLFELIGQAGEV